MDWTFHQVDFIMDHAAELPGLYTQSGSWSGHRRFAYDLVRFAQPKMIVELGTFFGTSFFSFCQAVMDGGLQAQCFAIDHWHGDPHSGYYGENVYEAVRTVADREFPGIGVLLRGDFRNVLKQKAELVERYANQQSG